MKNLEFKGTKGFKISKIERDSSGRSCYRFKEEGVLKATNEQLEANALIFESALDLLEALQLLLSQIPKNLKNDWLYGECEKANKAIEKALKP